MSYVLVVFVISCAFTPVCSVMDQKAVLTADSKEQCEEARAELLKIPGYFPQWVRCLPGKAAVPGGTP